jgi:hypothetical protein
MLRFLQNILTLVVLQLPKRKLFTRLCLSLKYFILRFQRRGILRHIIKFSTILASGLVNLASVVTFIHVYQLMAQVILPLHLVVWLSTLESLFSFDFFLLKNN